MKKRDLEVIGAGPSDDAVATGVPDLPDKSENTEKEIIASRGVFTGVRAFSTFWGMRPVPSIRKNPIGSLRKGPQVMLTLPLLFFVFLLCPYPLSAQDNPANGKKKPVYEEVDFEDLVKRYFGKSTGYSVEGIYAVSCVITKRSKKLLSKAERISIVAREDNYARVAIMKDWPGSNRDFIEVSLSYRKPGAFPIMGELDSMANGAGYIYTHVEPDGKRLSFSMLETDGLLEAEYSKTEKRKTITYRLSYLRIYPAVKEDVAAYGQP